MKKVFTRSPIYMQVRDAMVGRIASGLWKPGVLLPSEIDLAKEFGVSSGTMRKALDLLEAQYLVTRRQGRGTLVSDPSSDKTSLRLVRVCEPDGERIWGEIKSAEMTEAEATEVDMQRLRLTKGERVYKIKRLRLSRGSPFMFEEASVPVSLFPDLKTKGEDTHRILSVAQDYGIHIGKTQERITVAAASPPVADVLAVPVGTPIAVFDRTIENTDGLPVEWRMGWCNLGPNYYLVEL